MTQLRIEAESGQQCKLLDKEGRDLCKMIPITELNIRMTPDDYVNGTLEVTRLGIYADIRLSEEVKDYLRVLIGDKPKATRAVAGKSARCTACGCRWKIHANGMHQLYDAEQAPCKECDNAPNPPLQYE